MIKIIKTLSLLILFTGQLLAQADTLFYTPVDSLTYIVATGEKNFNHGQIDVKYDDKKYNKEELIMYLLELIRLNEERLWRLDLERIEANHKSQLYTDANKILEDLAGSGYLAKSLESFGKVFSGYYTVKVRGITIMIQLHADGKVDQVDGKGKKLPEGMTGTWEVWHQKRIRIKEFFPESIVPKGSVFNLNDEGELVSVSSIVKLKKIN